MSDDGVEVFAGTCDEFCELVERRKQHSAKELLRALRDVVPRLYQQAQCLPYYVSEALNDTFTQEQWQSLFKSLCEQFGEYNYYWEVYDPTLQQADEVVAGCIADDVADMYRELKAGLVAWHGGGETQKVAAVWHWRDGFETHWSQHATDALRAIDRYCSKWYLDEERLSK